MVIVIIPGQEELVSNIPAGDGKDDNLYLQCTELTICSKCVLV
jgi:hypothetical protein